MHTTTTKLLLLLLLLFLFLLLLRYPSLDAANPVHLFFPSMYHHFSSSAPYGFGNDGILDIRLVSTRDVKSTTANANLTYPNAPNGRSPFVPLGVTKCGADASRPGVPGGWCSIGANSTALRETTVDTSAMYMANGYLVSNDGAEVYL